MSFFIPHRRADEDLVNGLVCMCEHLSPKLKESCSRSLEEEMPQNCERVL